MAGMCCGVVGETEAAAAAVEPSSRASRRRRLELRPFKLVADMAVPAQLENDRKRQKLDLFPPSSANPVEVSPPRDCENAVENCGLDKKGLEKGNDEELKNDGPRHSSGVVVDGLEQGMVQEQVPRYGKTSICGRRRDMEDAVSIHTQFAAGENTSFFGVFDGHGCSHVAGKCRDRLHEIVKEEIADLDVKNSTEWEEAMGRSFTRMDKEVEKWTDEDKSSIRCRCELQTPQCDAVGSTAVTAVVTPDKIIVSNCGDSRAVLCRKGVAVPLSSDHKPDRPDELLRIEAAGGRVIYWDGPRVLGVLAMSRAIGDNYLKPYVIPDPEVTVVERTKEDECLILASDGLWDVVSNETACGVARMCLRAQKPLSPPVSPESEAAMNGGGAIESCSDKACTDGSILLTKLALARHSTDNVSVVVVDLRKNQL